MSSQGLGVFVAVAKGVQSVQEFVLVLHTPGTKVACTSAVLYPVYHKALKHA